MATKNLSAQVTSAALSGQVESGVLSKQETVKYFLNSCDCDLSLGGVFGDLGCDGILVLQELTTAYATRWLMG